MYILGDGLAIDYSVHVPFLEMVEPLTILCAFQEMQAYWKFGQYSPRYGEAGIDHTMPLWRWQLQSSFNLRIPNGSETFTDHIMPLWRSHPHSSFNLYIPNGSVTAIDHTMSLWRWHLQSSFNLYIPTGTSVITPCSSVSLHAWNALRHTSDEILYHTQLSNWHRFFVMWSGSV